MWKVGLFTHNFFLYRIVFAKDYFHKWHGEDDSNIPLGFWRPRHSLYTITVLKSLANSPLVAIPEVGILVGVEERAIAQVEVARFGSPHLRVKL